MTHSSRLRSRRDFLAACATGLVGLAGWRPAGPGPHPEPRPGIDGSRVLTAEQLADHPDLIPLFDGIRAIPHIADGIRCTCGCADLPGYRSFLLCFEGDGMAQWCERCQTTGAMIIRLHGSGRSLDQIRAAVDARFP